VFAIFKKDIINYFTTATGYLFLAISLSVSGLFFSLNTIMSATSNTGSYFNIIIFMMMIFLPILTMRSFSDERRTKTDQLLFTAPVPTISIVFGKFLSALTMFLIYLALSCLNFIPLFIFKADGASDPNVALIIGNLIALILLGMSFIAIGIFVSSLTENMFASALITIAILFLVSLIDIFNAFIPVYWIRTVISWISISSRYSAFSSGFFDIGALIYYLSITGIFIFLTERAFKARKLA
jgi:ABC-2 type transport system permease protein